MKILLGMQQQNSSPTLTVAYSESAWWPAGHYFGLYDQDTGAVLIPDLEINRIPQKVEVTLGQKLYIKATASSWGAPDPVMGIFRIENSIGVTFTNIPDSITTYGNLAFYITEINASFTFTYG